MIGKRVNGCLYLHTSALSTLPRNSQTMVKEASSKLPVNYRYNVVKITEKENAVSFIWCPRFNKEAEPRLAHSLKVKDGVVGKIREESKTNPSIYHGKHLFVMPDYKGFDVEEAEKRYKSWSGRLTSTELSKIGRLQYWEEIVERLKL